MDFENYVFVDGLGFFETCDLTLLQARDDHTVFVAVCTLDDLANTAQVRLTNDLHILQILFIVGHLWTTQGLLVFLQYRQVVALVVLLACFVVRGAFFNEFLHLFSYLRQRVLFSTVKSNANVGDDWGL